MSTPINHFYLRSTTDWTTEGVTGLETQTHSKDSLDLSNLKGSVVDSEKEELLEPQEMATPHKTLSSFHGDPGDKAEEWMTWYNNMVNVYKYDEEKRPSLLSFYLKDHAVAWYSSMPSETKCNSTAHTDALKDSNEGMNLMETWPCLNSLSQQHRESCTRYFTRILQVTNHYHFPEVNLSN